ncbi:MAG TPA: ABC transporter permease [Candidatus Acidoferrales bacterium]|nr:ABC transporter permease [Candidatus Acidoferrales bacterium]
MTLWWRKQRELRNELNSHLQMATQDRTERGEDPARARQNARRELGNDTLIRETTCDQWGSRWLETVLQDLRYALRMLRKSPGFTIVAIVTLALGIGANTAIFSVIYAALLRPLPYSQPSRLLTLSEVRHAEDTYWDTSYPDYQDWLKQSKAFQSLAGFSNDGFVFRGSGEPQLLFGAQATTNFFSTLGVKPILGYDFPAKEDIAAKEPKVALLTYGFWRRQFGGDANIVGRSIQLDNTSVTIIGVLPPSFEFAPTGNAQVWVPMHLGGDFKDLAQRRSLRWMHAIGRLAPGVTPAKAQAEMDAINARLAAAYPQANAAIQIHLVSLRDRIVGKVQPLLLILFGAVGFVLLIACANVANLMMVRAAGRGREFAIRTALGAGFSRLVSQLLTESLMLAIAGAALGFLAAQWGTSALVAAIPQPLLYSMPFLRDTQPNGVISAFLCGLAVLTGILFGLAPVFQISRERAGEVLKQETRAASGSSHARLRDALVVVEIAFSLVLLAGAGLAVQSLSALLRRNPGFDPHNLLTFSVNLPDGSYPKDADSIRFDNAFTSRLRAEPGVVSVGNTNIVPLSGGGNTVRFAVEGEPVRPGQEDESFIRQVSADYFSTLKIPLIEGRYFNDEADSATAPKHAIVNQAWVKTYLHGQHAIGKRFRFTMSPTQPYREIVGVVGNIADSQLDAHDEPALYLPFEQDGNSYINYVVRTAGNPVIALGAVREALTKTDPQLFPVLPLTMEQIIQQSPSVFMRRYPSYLIGSFALLALVLASIGLYGLISYSASQRTREIGIRVALGAQQRDVMRLVLGQGAKLTAIGLVIGLGAALGLTQFMGSVLYGVEATDPLTFGSVAVLFACVALAACYIPARRATRVDPVVALRHE